MGHLPKINFLRAEGDYYQVGQAIGRAQRKNIKSIFDLMIPNKELMELSKKVLPRHQETFPNFIEELKGMADGAGVPFLNLFALNCFENLFKLKERGERCTSLFWKGGGKTFVCHNEEEDCVNYGKLILVKVKIKNKCSFLSLNYPGILCGDSVSLNSYKMAQTVNTLHPKIEFKNGFARSFIGRALLESKTVKESCRILSKFPNFGGMHVLIYSAKKQGGIGVETFNKKIFKQKLDKGFYLHTNHYVFKPFINIEQNSKPISFSKLERGQELLNQFESPNEARIKLILSDHKKFPSSLCRHPNLKTGDNEATLASSIVDLNKMSFFVANGNPCENEYFEFRF